MFYWIEVRRHCRPGQEVQAYCYARRSARASVGAASGLTAWWRFARGALELGWQPAAATTGRERHARGPRRGASSRSASALVVSDHQLYFIPQKVIDRSQASQRTQNILAAYLMAPAASPHLPQTPCAPSLTLVLPNKVPRPLAPNKWCKLLPKCITTRSKAMLV